MNSLKFLLSALLLLISVSGLGAETGSSKPPLRFIAPTSPSEPIEVRTEGNNSFNGEIWLAIPRTAVAVSLANVKGQNPTPLSKENGVLVEGGDGKWAAWLDQSRTRSDLSIRLTGNLPAGESLRISLPLNSSAEGKLTIGTRYLPTSGKLSASSHLNIHFMQPSQSGKSGQACDGLTFYANAKNPTALEWGKPVDLIWKIRNASAAILHRPNGSFEKLDSSRIEQGTIQVMPVEWGQYVLKATLGDFLCEKSVIVAPADPAAGLGILVHPRTVLPFGNVTVHWAISNVRGKEPEPTLEYADENGITTNRVLPIGSTGMESGNFPLTAPGLGNTHEVSIGYGRHSKSANYRIAVWQRLDEKPGVSLPTTSPRSLTYVSIDSKNNNGALILCTDKGLWKADLERGKVIPQFASFDSGRFANGAECLNATALAKGFAAVRKKDGKLELLVYTDIAPSQPIVKSPISLNEALATTETNPKIAMVAVHKNDGNERVYIVSNGSAYSYSFNIEPGDEVAITQENMLSGVLADKPHALFSRHGSLFALRNDIASSTLLRFPPLETTGKGGSLGSPKLSTVTFPKTNGIPKIADGIPVVVDGVFVFLGDYSNPGSKYIHDVVYDPRTNKWLAAGHGLNARAGSVAAYRSEGERRLWVITPDRQVQTLSVASGRYLFVGAPLDRSVAEEKEYLAPCAAEASSSDNGTRCALLKAHLEGGYRKTCHVIPTSADTLEGTCNDARGVKQQAVLKWVSQCQRDSIINSNGKLACSYESDFLGWVELDNCNDIIVDKLSGELTAKCSANATAAKQTAKFPSIRVCLGGTLVNDNGSIRCMLKPDQYPNGGWKETCSDAWLTAEDTLEASCKPAHTSSCRGDKIQTALRWASKCQANTIGNDDGVLICQYIDDFQTKVELRNCSDVVVKTNGGKRNLTANCAGSANGSIRKVYFQDIGACKPGTLINDGGIIKCIPNTERYGGNWTASCKDGLLTEDDALEGTCKGADNSCTNLIPSVLQDADSCVRGHIVNVNGKLRCERSTKLW